MPQDRNGNTYYIGVTYRLRAGSPIYDQNGNAYLHTFGSETNEVWSYECVQGAYLPSSDDFMGQGGGMASASFSKIGDRDDYLQGKVVYEPKFGTESIIIDAFSGKTKNNEYPNEVTFIECSSLNVSYDIMGLVTVSYTVVSNTPGVKFFYSVSTGSNGKTYSGFPTNISYNVIPNTESWFETHVTMMAVTAGSNYTKFNTNYKANTSIQGIHGRGWKGPVLPNKS